ncbi:hypothetical protein BaRGS_00021198 [Batillaria attramentaria]|uniref:Uncharacterized protein n=1 Tax=Batillaria attramentaria TaxID=370345 RepID=A0ABD0KJV7_9CAEN
MFVQKTPTLRAETLYVYVLHVTVDLDVCALRNLRLSSFQSLALNNNTPSPPTGALTYVVAMGLSAPSGCREWKHLALVCRHQFVALGYKLNFIGLLFEYRFYWKDISLLNLGHLTPCFMFIRCEVLNKFRVDLGSVVTVMPALNCCVRRLAAAGRTLGNEEKGGGGKEPSTCRVFRVTERYWENGTARTVARASHRRIISQDSLKTCAAALEDTSRNSWRYQTGGLWCARNGISDTACVCDTGLSSDRADLEERTIKITIME